MKLKLIILFVFGTSSIFGQSYQLNVADSKLTWTGKAALNAYSLSGNLTASNGTLKIEKQQLKAATIVVDMKSLSADNKDLQSHLRGKDFFQVKKYTKAVFKLTQPIDLTKKSCIAYGQLTVKGITKPYSFPISIQKVGKKYKVTGTLTIDRTDFGIYYNSPNYFKNLKQNAIADDFLLELELFFE